MDAKYAVTILVDELSKDPHYFYAWQANIAMAFKDECSRNNVDFESLHEVANQAAINFLNLLIRK